MFSVLFFNSKFVLPLSPQMDIENVYEKGTRRLEGGSS